MDAIRLLGGLLGGRGGSGGTGGLGQQILQQVLAGQHQAPQPVQRPVQRTQPARGGGQAGNLLGSLLRDVLGRSQTRQAPTPQVQHQPVQQQQQHHDHHHDHGYNDQQLNERAEVLLRAMINAAKADGSIDQQEQDNIVSRLGDISPQESQFLREEFRRPLDVHAYAHSVPRGMEDEVYSISLMAINLDTNPEANYLRELAECLRIDPGTCNEIHHRYGAPRLFN